MYWMDCSAADGSRPHSCTSHETVSASLPLCTSVPSEVEELLTTEGTEVHRGETPGRRSLISRRNSAKWNDSSSVRAGASPRQKGTLGGAPWASSTSTRPDFPSTRRIRHEVLPSSMMSPALLSTAKSSSSVPTSFFNDTATTENKAVS